MLKLHFYFTIIYNIGVTVLNNHMIILVKKKKRIR
jgi:hypothetical protein